MFERALNAFYGGTFDPVHYGHLRSVIAMAQLVKLQRVILLPNSIPPHRPLPLAAAPQRLAMIKLAIADFNDPLFTLDTRELQQPTPSYTVETFTALRREYGPDAPLAFILGQDALLMLPQWHRGLELLTLCHLLVCARPGYDNGLASTQEHCWFASRLTSDLQALHRQAAGLIYYVATPQLAISATDIRTRYREGGAGDGLISPSVHSYIAAHGLYRL